MGFTDVHPPKYGTIGFDPWPYGKIKVMFQTNQQAVDVQPAQELQQPFVPQALQGPQALQATQLRTVVEEGVAQGKDVQRMSALQATHGAWSVDRYPLEIFK